MGEDDKTYSQEIQDRIRELAHSMWEWAGRQQDTALEYWVAAEKEVLASLRATAERLTPGQKPEKATEPETEAAAAAAAPAAAAAVETGATPAAGAEQAEQPKPKAAKPKKK
ncbi:MAG: DUF2934 domain-containing protein [Defluviicoccus sp.]